MCNDSYSTQNTAERQRLIRLTTHLSEQALNRPVGNGWTVATRLTHLAFWDQYTLALLKQWERTGYKPSSAEVDAINDAARVLSLAIPPKAAVQLAQAAAEAVDRHLEAINPELEAAIQASGRVWILRRAMHRREHLDQIEKALTD